MKQKHRECRDRFREPHTPASTCSFFLWQPKKYECQAMFGTVNEMGHTAGMCDSAASSQCGGFRR